MKDEKTGDDLVSIGFVVDLEYADATTSAARPAAAVQDAPARAEDPRGRRARRLGRQGAAGRRLLVDAEAHDAGRAARRRRRRAWSTRSRSRASTTASGPASSPPRRSTRALKRGGDRPRRAYEEAVEESLDRQGALRGAQHAPAVPEGLHPGRPDRQPGDRDEGQAAARPRCAWHRNDERGDVHRRHARAAIPSPTASTRSTSSRRVFITGNATRDDAPNHIRVQKNVPREVAETWKWMCPAGVYEIPDDAPETRRRRRDRQLHQLRAVRRDHRQGRAPDDARGRRRAALPDHLGPATPQDPGLIGRTSRILSRGPITLDRGMSVETGFELDGRVEQSLDGTLPARRRRGGDLRQPRRARAARPRGRRGGGRAVRAPGGRPPERGRDLPARGRSAWPAMHASPVRAGAASRRRSITSARRRPTGGGAERALADANRHASRRSSARPRWASCGSTPTASC